MCFWKIQKYILENSNLFCPWSQESLLHVCKAPSLEICREMLLGQSPEFFSMLSGVWRHNLWSSRLGCWFPSSKKWNGCQAALTPSLHELQVSVELWMQKSSNILWEFGVESRFLHIERSQLRRSGTDQRSVSLWRFSGFIILGLEVKIMDGQITFMNDFVNKRFYFFTLSFRITEKKLVKNANLINVEVNTIKCACEGVWVISEQQSCCFEVARLGHFFVKFGNSLCLCGCFSWCCA